MSTTDDTRQRSVAEIIGWKYEGEDELYPAQFYTDAAGEPRAGLDPVHTPDDMLEWLREHIHHDVWNNNHVVMIAATDSGVDVQWYSEEGISEAHGATLHEALEAAVRAVAEVSGE